MKKGERSTEQESWPAPTTFANQREASTKELDFMKKLKVWALACLLVIATSTVFASPPTLSIAPPRIDAMITEPQLNAVEYPALAAVHSAVLVTADENSPPKTPAGAFVAAVHPTRTASVLGGGRSPATIASGIVLTT